MPRRSATTKTLFKSPPGFPNAIAVTPEGLWIGEQKMSGALAKQYNVPEPADLREAAWLVDWNGKLLKTIMTASRNTSGMAVGGGYLWMGAEFAPPYDGIYQYDMDGKLIAQRQVPLGTAGGRRRHPWRAVAGRQIVGAGQPAARHHAHRSQKLDGGIPYSPVQRGRPLSCHRLGQSGARSGR